MTVGKSILLPLKKKIKSTVHRLVTPSTFKKHSFHQPQDLGSKPKPKSQFCPLSWGRSPLHNKGATPLIRVGRCLQAFTEMWQGKIADDWVHNIVARGYRLKCQTLPPSRFMLSNVSSDPENRLVLLQALNLLLSFEEIVLEDERFLWFYSNLFTVQNQMAVLVPSWISRNSKNF